MWCTHAHNFPSTQLADDVCDVHMSHKKRAFIFLWLCLFKIGGIWSGDKREKECVRERELDRFVHWILIHQFVAHKIDLFGV